MSTSDPTDAQRFGETPQPWEPTGAPSPTSRQALRQSISPGPARPRRSALRWLIVAGVLLLALVVAGVGATSWESSQPTATVAGFCGALKSQSYSAVYQQIPTSAKSARSESGYTQDAQLQDQLDGRVRACAVVRNGKDPGAWSQTPQTMTLQIERNHDYSGALTLVRDGLGWKIGALDTTALGPIVGPWEAAQRFCAALTAGDFAAAYGALSRQGQANASQEQFTKAFTDALASSKAQIASCQLDVATYVAQPAAASVAQPAAASVVATLAVQMSTVNGAVSAPVKVTFSLVNEADAWKIDRIQPFSGS
jgi:hypothetical protein